MNLEYNSFYPDREHFRYDRRVWDRNGWIIDLGCLGWDWTAPFIGKKKVIGSDPNETYKSTPEEARLFINKIGVFGHWCRDDGESVATLDQMIKLNHIDSIDILKMNIEGAEYGILLALKEPIADQIIVAFHSHIGFPPFAIEAVKYYLSPWYTWYLLSNQYNWHLFLRREKFINPYQTDCYDIYKQVG